ncbi:MAG: DUF3861 domain-containing protein [Weeksellaceae bacterium]|jgi:hypothetical protein|nr:DUF3861 domain-containing protein [Weeksellaceae bacterium]
MTEKRIHQYELTFKYLKNNKGEIMDKTPIFLPFQNYDDIYKIIEILNEKNLFKDASQTNQFVLGLKLFGDVMMKNKDLELFSEMRPAFMDFMKKLKSK